MSVRTRYLINSIIIIFSLPAIFHVGVLYGISVLLLAVVWLVGSVFLTIYTIERNYRFPEQLIFAILPFLYLLTVILVALHYSLMTLQGINAYWVFFYIFAAFVQYFMFLVINIINTATVRTVPLLKAAQSTILSFSLMLGVTWSLYLQNTDANLAVIAWLWAIFSFFIALALFYIAQIDVVREFTGVIKIPFTEALTVAFLQGYLVIMTAGWDMTIALRTLYWVSSLALFVMIVRARRQRKLTKRTLREFSLIQWVILIAVIVGGIRFG